MRNRLRNALKSVNVLNAALLVCICALAVWLVPPFLDTGSLYPVPVPQEAAQPEAEKPPDGPARAVADHHVVAEQNLFHPERKFIDEQKEEQQVKPEFVLYGTIVMDGFNMAYMEDMKSPQTSPGRGKRQVALRQGAILSGYTLKEVQADRVVMARGKDEVTVMLPDAVNKRQDGKVAPKAQQPQRPQPPQRRTPQAQ
jgi:type II secretory pathway component PulC